MLRIGLILSLLLLAAPAFAERAHGPLPPTVTVCFTPGENCEDRVVQIIGEAKKQILIQAYGFTSTPILSAVKAAHDRGVEIMVILDKSNDRGHYSAATYLTNADIPVWIDLTPGIAHNKVMVVDHQTVITGSYNFTKSALMRNAENLLVVFNAPVAHRFEDNWNARLLASKAYEGLPDAADSSQ